jgi:hypothetical protein
MPPNYYAIDLEVVRPSKPTKKVKVAATLAAKEGNEREGHDASIASGINPILMDIDN